MNQTQTPTDAATDTAYFTLQADSETGIATLTFDSPDSAVNTFTRETLEELDAQLTELERRAKAGEITGVIFASAKQGNFIAGADIHLIQEISDSRDGERAAEAGQAIFARIQDLPVPTLAAINGSCLGGGLELSLACDYRTAADSPKTTIGLPETQLGVLPGWGGTFRLPRTVGWAQATKMILAGSTIDARRALKYGLVDMVYPPAFFDEWTRALLRRITADGGDRQLARNRKKARARRSWWLERTPIGRRVIFHTARKDVLKKTGGHYPAPLEALSVLRKTTGGSLTHRAARTRAHRKEAAAFGRLAATEISTNLTRLFFAREGAKRQPALTHARTDRPITRAAVLGAGVMGGRIAWLFSNKDIPVVMKDIAWDAVNKGYQSAKEVYDQLKQRRKLDDREINLKLNQIHGAVEYHSLGHPDIVVEAVVERLDVKKSVLAELEEHIADDTIVVSNTSALSIDEMAGAMKRPQRFAGMHFFNPVNRMPLVEVIRGERTADAVLGDVTSLALRLGKTPVVVKNSPGFLVNRLLLPYLNEAAVMLSEGVEYPAADELFTTFGMPMGPYTLLDEVGIDVGFHVAKTLYHAFGERMATAPALDSIKDDSNLLGKKAGAGFYTYTRGKKQGPNPRMKEALRDALAGRAGGGSQPESAGARPAATGRPTDRDIFDRAMLNMVNEAAYALEEDVVGSAEELDLAMIMGTGFPPFRGGLLRWADSLGTGEIRERLQELAVQYGPRFAPAPLLTRLADEGRSFYQGE
ncbi:MAG: 3-hydroxyacyl-CoA dehydrogenase NAD-binding domain-containing protein [Alkalispirochaeta sp.]